MLRQANALHQSGKLKDAKSLYLEVLVTHPNDAEVLHWLGILYAEENNLDTARDYLEQSLAIDNKPTVVLHLANVLKAQGLYAQAATLLEELIAKQQNYAMAYNNLGTIYYAQAKLNEAVTTYQTAIDLRPDYVDAYYNLGLALTKLGQIMPAQEAYRAVISLAPDHAAGQFQLACLYMQTQNYDAAIDQFKQITEHHPFHFETQTNLATSFLREGNLLSAKEYYLKALTLKPDDQQVLFNLGVIAMQLGQIPEAIPFYLTAVKYDVDFYDAHQNLAFCYLMMKQNDLALQHFREALRLNPANESIQHTIRILMQEKDISTSPPAYIQALFDSYADHFESHLMQKLHYQVPKKMLEAMKAMAPLEEKQWDILDLGCGTGLAGELFKPHANTLVGVDLSEKMLAIAKQKNIYDQLFPDEITHFLRSQYNMFDFIIGADVLVYSGDLSDVFVHLVHALKRDGYVIFNTEILEEGSFAMTASGRFAHSEQYLRGLANEHHLHIVFYQRIPMRFQNDVFIQGHLVLLQKKGER